MSLDSGWATQVNNCIIDRYGRIGSRKGWRMLTSDPDTLTSGEPIEAIFEYKEVNGDIQYLCAGDEKLFSTGDGAALVEHTVRNAADSADVVYPITGNNWKFAGLPFGAGVGAVSYGYAAQIGHPLLCFNKHTTTSNYVYQRVADVGAVPTGTTVSTFDPQEVLSAFGRIWAAVTTNNKTTVFYSTLLDGTDFTAAGSGVIDISSVVGNNDEIVALAAHNNFLVIFCKEHVVIYANADDVTNITLADTIDGIGCIAANSVQNTGTDLLFLSRTGLRALGRVIQEKSAPLRELSLNIRDDFYSWFDGVDMSTVRSVYSEDDAFYLITIPTLERVVCFDTRSVLPNGALKVTLWDQYTPKAFCSRSTGGFLIGQIDGIGVYYGYLDNGETYPFSYYTNYFDLGSPTLLKALKRISAIVIGGNGQSFVFKYAFDYTDSFRGRALTLAGTSAGAEYGIAEYSIGEYFGGVAAQALYANLGGTGRVIQLGVEAVINDRALSIQKVDVAVVTGKNTL